MWPGVQRFLSHTHTHTHTHNVHTLNRNAWCRDGTVEVVEVHLRNAGRDPFPLLLSRRRLPKTPSVPPVGAPVERLAFFAWVYRSSQRLHALLN
jgi:hypothetical protein